MYEKVNLETSVHKGVNIKGINIWVKVNKYSSLDSIAVAGGSNIAESSNFHENITVQFTLTLTILYVLLSLQSLLMLLLYFHRSLFPYFPQEVFFPFSKSRHFSV